MNSHFALAGPRAVPARSASPTVETQEDPDVCFAIHPLRTGTVRAPEPGGLRAVPARSASPTVETQEDPDVCFAIHPLRTGTVRAPVFTSSRADFPIQPARRKLPPMPPPNTDNWTWLCSGDEVFPAMLAAIAGAQKSVSLETYMLAAGKLAEEFRTALITARSRGVTVRLLIDAIGSLELPDGFLEPLRRAGVEVRVFNPLTLRRMSIRNHRKLLVCDERVAFIGGFNIADDYLGDGVTRGWSDLGVRLKGALVDDLDATFDEMFALADFRHKRPIRLARGRLKRKLVHESSDQLLLGGPGRGRSFLRRTLLADLRQARRVQIIVPYFIPSWRIRRLLARAARRGGQVQLLLPGKSDVALVQLAGRSLYRRLLRAGVEIYEYQPQVLHSKLFVLDDNVYVGSSNLDPRSLSINYELLVRRHDAAEAVRARTIFAAALAHSRRIGREEMKLNSGLWTRLKEYFAYWLLVRIDPHVARRQWRALPE